MFDKTVPQIELPNAILIDGHISIGAQDFGLIADSERVDPDTPAERVVELMKEKLPPQTRLRIAAVLHRDTWSPMLKNVGRLLGPDNVFLAVPADRWSPGASGLYVRTPEQRVQCRDRLDGIRAVMLDLEGLGESVLEDFHNLVADHPAVPFVFASLGGRFWRFAMLLACRFDHVYLDTVHLTRRRLRSMFANRYQLARFLWRLQDRIIFGSGFPVMQSASVLHILLPWCRDAGMVRKIVQTNGERVFFGVKK